jgi:hypothetical protein
MPKQPVQHRGQGGQALPQGPSDDREPQRTGGGAPGSPISLPALPGPTALRRTAVTGTIGSIEKTAIASAGTLAGANRCGGAHARMQDAVEYDEHPYAAGRSAGAVALRGAALMDFVVRLL